MPTHDDSYYQLSKTLNPSGHDNFYSHYPNYSADSASAAAYGNLMASHRQKADRGLLPPADYPIGPNRSRPVSVASSIASDSPATPSMGEPEDDRRRKTGEDPEIIDCPADTYSLFFDDAAFSAVPKLDRTMTDIYSDELFNPNFTITSASPSQQAHISVSPSNEVFAQRLHAANNQHLSAHSPVSSTPRDRSPFRQGSPLAPAPSHDFGGAGRMGFASAQQMREQRKAEHDAEVLRQQIGHATDAGTPQTISPKDAILEFHEQDGENNFPLFPAQDSTGFDSDHLAKAAAATAVQANSQFNDMSLGGAPFNNYLQSQLPTGLQIPQHYPFVAQPRQQSSSASMGSTSMGVPSRVSSADSATPDSMLSASPQRPAGTSADGGTYTCTYHGCTLRFETPALLQKHKREGHRQTHGLNPVRRVDTGMTSSLLNSQAGPHRCDRINPSTGKPCNTVFSRPYDLTRHEDTIHNARKQKVRCDLCTEEKTFSRADALTRHYRVCHPDVEFPGKHRRRGPSSG
ncbi:putative 26s proteasome regulatory subunit-like protein [Phaeoacremonium minimum UCRPA7]|uniref:Putative 26s proteasome regulatory subunit-like protein n=1 Tax=Phaeoacremonium minimum (strain UCR-PA7) TaxID=1286976 RepID=R8BCH4_PHAM7|nr:putative 26s proteasome regulatory subunit-like protein [Phaeoacremonium minimum UCRPA7]EON97001.1 putative 26s proteasome regulatory subunit-like protein [Phaeoacremonium minimum UCRPA7]